jgi:hypothetical protein
LPVNVESWFQSLQLSSATCNRYTAEDFAAFTEALGYPNFGYDGTGGNAVRKNVVVGLYKTRVFHAALTLFPAMFMPYKLNAVDPLA